jgi:hypothetical protein
MLGGIFILLDYVKQGNYSWLLCLLVVLVIIGALILGSRSRQSISSQNIGDISMRIGYDVRDLLIAGYTWKEIDGILKGEYSLEELLARGPATKRNTRK